MSEEKLLGEILQSGRHLIKLNFLSRPFSLLSSYISVLLRKKLAEVVICHFPESARRFFEVSNKRYIYATFPERPDQVVVFIDIILLLEMFYKPGPDFIPFKELLFCVKDTELILEVFKTDDLYRTLFNYDSFFSVYLNDFGLLYNKMNALSKCSNTEKNIFNACLINFYNHISTGMFDKIYTFPYYITARQMSSTTIIKPMFEKSDNISFFKMRALYDFAKNYLDIDTRSSITYTLQVYTTTKPSRKPFLKTVDKIYDMVEFKFDSVAKCINEIFKDKETIVKHNSFFIYAEVVVIEGNRLTNKQDKKIYTVHDCLFNPTSVPESIRKDILRLNGLLDDIF